MCITFLYHAIIYSSVSMCRTGYTFVITIKYTTKEKLNHSAEVNTLLKEGAFFHRLGRSLNSVFLTRRDGASPFLLDLSSGKVLT